MGDDYDFSEPFDAKAWAMYHDRICAYRWSSADEKLAFIIKAGTWAAGIIVAVLLATLGWSLKANYDSTQAALHAVQQTAAVASDETVRKLGGRLQPPPSSGN